MSRASSALVETRAVASARNGTRTQRQQVELRIVGRRAPTRAPPSPCSRRPPGSGRRRPRRSRRTARPPRAPPGSPAPPRRRRPAPGRTAPPRPARARSGCAGRRSGSRRPSGRSTLHVALAERDHAARTGSRPRRTRRARRCRSPAPTPSRSARSTAFIIMATMSGSMRVHLGVELEAEDAVAQIEDRRAARCARPRRRRRGSASSESARGSVGIGVKPPRCAELAGLPAPSSGW